jgi:hypothetical protein
MMRFSRKSRRSSFFNWVYADEPCLGAAIAWVDSDGRCAGRGCSLHNCGENRRVGIEHLRPVSVKKVAPLRPMAVALENAGADGKMAADGTSAVHYGLHDRFET